MKKYFDSGFPFRRILTTAAFLLLLPLILTGWPLDGLEIRHSGPASSLEAPPLFHTPVLLGRGMSTAIIHSVQLTPVMDEYRIQEGRLEIVQCRSHYADK